MHILYIWRKLIAMKKRVIPNLPEEVSQKLKEIGLKVKEHRKLMEPNYKKFAEKHKLNYMTLWRIENGENFSMVSFIEILNAVGITFEEFFKDMK